MDITKSQSDFEAWVVTWWPKSKTMIAEKFDDGGYWNMPLQQYFEVWKAARESIEVELPPRKSADIESEKHPDMTMYEAMMREGIWNDCIFECEKILRTAGIRIKGESE